MATANFNIQPNDGWVAVTPGAVNYVLIKQYPVSHPIYVTSAASPPASTVRGYRVADGAAFVMNVPTTDIFYVRTENFKPDVDLRVDVFYIS